ncbi:MAG TPA: hypothetical protein DEQ04_02100 [Thermovirga lienii]|nr:hypothetical protein [Thermovirga lienii]
MTNLLLSMPKASFNTKFSASVTKVNFSCSSIVALIGWVQAGVNAPYQVIQLDNTLSALCDIPHGAG